MGQLKRLARFFRLMKYRDSIDPELRKFAINVPFNRATILLDRLYSKAAFALLRVPKGIKRDSIVLKSFDGLSFKTEIIECEDAGEKAPSLIFIHGGAFCYERAPYHKKLALYIQGLLNAEYILQTITYLRGIHFHMPITKY